MLFDKTLRFTLAAVLATGVAGALAAPAQAAPLTRAQPKCYAGLWKTTGLKAVIHGKAPTGYTQHVVYKGMAGIKLKVTSKRLVYDFTGSQRETFSGTGTDGKRVKGWEKLTGVLYLPSKVSSDTKGLKGQIASYNKKASGPATGTGMNTLPTQASWGGWKVAAHARIGHFDTPVIKKAKFLCDPKKKMLYIRDVRKWDTFTETVEIKLQLVRR